MKEQSSFTDMARCINCKMYEDHMGRDYCRYRREYFDEIFIFTNKERNRIDPNTCHCAMIQLKDDEEANE